MKPIFPTHRHTSLLALYLLLLLSLTGCGRTESDPDQSLKVNRIGELLTIHRIRDCRAFSPGFYDKLFFYLPAAIKTGRPEQGIY